MSIQLKFSISTVQRSACFGGFSDALENARETLGMKPTGTIEGVAGKNKPHIHWGSMIDYVLRIS